MSYRREKRSVNAGVPTTCGGTVRERTGARSPYRLKKRRNYEKRRYRADRMPGNVIEMIGRQWMLVMAGSGSSAIPRRPASGIRYKQPAATVYIRPQRYTRELVMLSRGLPCHSWGGVPPGAGLLRHSGRTRRRLPPADRPWAYAGRNAPVSAVPKSCWSRRKMYRTGSDPRNFWRSELIGTRGILKRFHYLYICATEKGICQGVTVIN